MPLSRRLVLFVLLACLGAGVALAKEIAPEQGVYVASRETEVAGPHGLRGRAATVAKPPPAESLKPGWSYNKDAAGKKVGAQVYVDKSYVSVEFFVEGRKLSTASYREGKPSGWFYRFDEKRKKHGLQHYFDGDYLSVELYEHGLKTWAGSYRKGKPSGWFYTYKDKKKHGVQKYVDGDYWAFETYVDGRKHGESGSFRKGRKDGWFYTWNQGKKTGQTYYEAGVAK